MIFTTAIFKPWLFCSHATSHKADWILTTCCLLCLGLLYAQVISLMKVLEVERSGLSLLKNSTATTFLVCVLWTQCWWLLAHTFLFLFLSYCCCWFTYNQFDLNVSIAFAYCFHAKWYWTVSICVTIVFGDILSANFWQKLW